MELITSCLPYLGFVVWQPIRTNLDLRLVGINKRICNWRPHAIFLVIPFSRDVEVNANVKAEVSCRVVSLGMEAVNGGNERPPTFRIPTFTRHLFLVAVWYDHDR